jgi:heptosyltransferase-2
VQAAGVTTANSMLIVGPAWVGDMVMAQTLFKLLRDLNPGIQVDVLAPAWSLPILARMPEVRRGIAMPIGHGRLDLAIRRRLGHDLRSTGYDQAILLPNSFKSALVPWFARIPRRTGWRGEMRYGLLNDLRKLDKQRYPLMIQRFAALAYPNGAALPSSLPFPALTIDAAGCERLLTQFGLADAPFLALCPGAEFGPAKRWPEKHYAMVAAAMIERGWRVAIFGSGNDQPVAENIVQALLPTQRERVVNLAGHTRLEQAVDLLSGAAAVVSNDSGLMHIAAAVGRPLVVVYGSTSPGFTPPLAERVRVLQIPVDCGPCFQRECPLGHLKCLETLYPAQVLSALAELIDAPAQAVEVR